MKKPLTPPPIAERQKHFEQKIANQHPTPMGMAPTPTDTPCAVPDPLKGKK